ncbi:hypothetical protein RA20_14440 [Leisingera sp. ANG-Vp]|nr:hypothetical protein RA20_14440 [Leisingera sp. ANG-Vp]
MKECVIIILQPLPGKFDALAALVKEMTEQVCTQPGNLQAEVLLAPARNEIAVFQRWSSAEAFSEYLIWRSKQEDLQQVYDLSANEPDFKSFTLCT